MRLVMYSGGRTQANDRLHRILSDLVGSKKKKTFTYIPSSHDGADVFYNRAVRRYKKFGFKNFNRLDLDLPIHRDLLHRALDSDVLYFAGGNTFYLLHHLKKSGVMPMVQRFVKKNEGVLAGLSAGGLLMTPTIRLAGYPKFFADDNEVGLKQLSAFGFVSFEFFPHYYKSEKLDRALLRYSSKSRFPIIATEDGGGIVVDGDHFDFVGSNYIFRKEKFSIRELGLKSVGRRA